MVLMHTLLHVLRLLLMLFLVQDLVVSQAPRSFYHLLILLSMRRY
ncbi:hypothetical protein Ahy_B04g070044 isoform B [Arachis hypogaea]|uniref:Uncharacterized protein n=1 Tax=Arachis hypogaea TaxID=3818 RepID=A0A444ZED3_ARAHY|nr:hypothetical protein Ahy_B04g070044 isoform B [Arachis hypogaea]